MKSDHERLRDTALASLAQHKDDYAQELLLAGLKDSSKALVEPSRALQLLSHDVHSEVHAVARDIFADPPDEETRLEAAHVLASDPDCKVLRALGRLGEYGRQVVPALEALRRDVPALASEIDAVLEQLGPSAPGSCCCGAQQPSARPAVPGRPSLGIDDLDLQDQDGRALTFHEFFGGHPTIAVFFYTRCDNPRKCQLTIAKLARVQQLIGDEEISTAAFTYDPAYDLPGRLRSYGEAFGLRMDDDHRLLRTAGKLDPLRSYFDLGVSKAGSRVTHHRIEAFVLDCNGAVAASATHTNWKEEELVEAARDLARAAA